MLPLPTPPRRPTLRCVACHRPAARLYSGFGIECAEARGLVPHSPRARRSDQTGPDLFDQPEGEPTMADVRITLHSLAANVEIEDENLLHYPDQPADTQAAELLGRALRRVVAAIAPDQARRQEVEAAITAAMTGEQVTR